MTEAAAKLDWELVSSNAEITRGVTTDQNKRGA